MLFAWTEYFNVIKALYNNCFEKKVEPKFKFSLI